MTRVRVALAAAAVLLSITAAIGIPDRSALPDVIYVVDVSRSHGPDPEQLVARARERWLAERASYRQVAVVAAGASARVLQPSAAEFSAEIPAVRSLPPAFADGSRIDLALADAPAAADGRAATVIVFSDGRFDPDAVARAARTLEQAGVPVRFAGALAEPAADLRFETAEPAEVVRGVARVEVGIASTSRDVEEVTVELEGAARRWPALVVPPHGRVAFRAEIPVDLAHHEVRLHLVRAAGPDACPANDVLAVPLQRPAERRAALIGDGHEAPVLAALLDRAGFVIERVPSFADLPPAACARFDLIVASDVAAAASGRGAEVLAELRRVVTEQSVGLWVVGGPHAFRAGGYAASALEDLLPLSSAPDQARDVVVLLDHSGSMEKGGRLDRAADAVLLLAAALAPADRLRVIPFSVTPDPPLPAEPVAGAEFPARGGAALRALSARGGTRLLPALEAVLALPPVPTRQRICVMLSDAEDDTPGLDAELRRLRERFAAARVETIALLLDPDPATRAHVDALGAARRDVPEVTPRILLDAVEPQSWEGGPIATRRGDGASGPTLPWRNRVRAGKDAVIALTAAGDGRPLLAEGVRGKGRVAAFAAWPADADARDLDAVPGRIARPAGWAAPRLAPGPGGWRVTWPAGDSGPVRLALLVGGVRHELAETAPGIFEIARLPDGAAGALTLADAGGPIGSVVLPAAGDPEYRWPPSTPAGAIPGGALPARSRTPSALLAALAWAGFVVLRGGARRTLRSETDAGR